MSLYMVFDVESVGLHGAGFAVGWVVVERFSKSGVTSGVSILLEQRLMWCHPAQVPSSYEDKRWVLDNVLPSLPHERILGNPQDVRERFWQAWMRWWDGPYPLEDIASVRRGVGLDPLAKEPRLPDELPEHNPLADARQSARLLMEALSRRDSAPI